MDGVKLAVQSEGERREGAVMGTTLTVKDETTFGIGGDHTFTLDFPHARITAGEIIRERVYAEVGEHNAKNSGLFRGLVQPTGAERTLNGFKVGEGRRIDPEEQYGKAVEAFYRNGFILLVDDRQVEDLDQVVDVRPETTVTFLKLVPLVGG